MLKVEYGIDIAFSLTLWRLVIWKGGQGEV